DQHVIPFHLHREALVRHLAVEAVLAALDVELPAVPGAGDYGAVQSPFAERAAGVRANAIQGVKRPLDVVEGDDLVIGHDFFGRPGGYITDRGAANVTGHETSRGIRVESDQRTQSLALIIVVNVPRLPRGSALRGPLPSGFC